MGWNIFKKLNPNISPLSWRKVHTSIIFGINKSCAMKRSTSPLVKERTWRNESPMSMSSSAQLCPCKDCETLWPGSKMELPRSHDLSGKIKGKKRYVLRKQILTIENWLEGIWDGIVQRGVVIYNRWCHRKKISLLASGTWSEQNIQKISHQHNFYLLKKRHLKICSWILFYIIFCNWGFKIIPNIHIS